MADPTSATCSSVSADLQACDQWSSGYLSRTGCQLPAACLQHCLDGDPNKLATRGCWILRELALRETPLVDVPDDSDRISDVSEICEKGFWCTAKVVEEADSPCVIVLAPKPKMPQEQQWMEGAIETLRQLTVQQYHLSRENEGLANEVLSGYEQVNLIFDISREVADLRDSREISRVLMEKLRFLFRADSIFYINRQNDRLAVIDQDNALRIGQVSAVLEFQKGVARWKASSPRSEGGGEDRIVLPAECPAAMTKLEEIAEVFASSDHETQLKRGHGTSIWGRLFAGPNRSACVGVVRRGKPFDACDLLLLDSTLTYGGHILSNLYLVEQLRRANFENVRALVNAIDQKDPYTCGHSERVGFLAKIIGIQMGLDSEEVQRLEWGGLLHDIGKIGIPESVLNKPGPLSEEEFAVIKDHPARGYKVLEPVESLHGIIEIVLHHHETPDGTGYPDGLKGGDIPLLARILHVADTFDALTSTRSYRKAFDDRRAIEIIKKDTGPKLDPEIVEHFLAAWAELPRNYPDEYQRWFSPRGEGRP